MYQGNCLCGKVTLSMEAASPSVSACHCSMCRRWSAGPLLSMEATEITFQGEEFIERYKSSDWAERGFCKTCGSSLFYHGIYDNSYYVPVDLFGTIEGSLLKEEIFYDKKPDYYCFSNDTKKLTEAQILEMVSAEFKEE